MIERCEEFHDNGKIKEKYTLRDGKLCGLFKMYHENGKVQVVLPYNDNVLDGEYKSYYESGKISGTGTYKNGELVGFMRDYYENGQLRNEMFWDDNGVLNGIYRDYYERGKLQEEGTFKNGSLEGQSIIYREDGSIHQIFTYKSDLKIHRKIFDKRGRLELDRDIDWTQQWVFGIDFPQNLSNFRKERNISPKEMSDMLSVQESDIEKWETYKCEPLPKYIPKMADILGVTVKDLIARDLSELAEIFGVTVVELIK
jgi:antitoxin component YwqK of YwqJK toxin-antitoxin module/DNA-binding XRE family transcriptional regulator